MTCRWVWKWHTHYDPTQDMEHKMVQQSATALQLAKQAEYTIKEDLEREKDGPASNGAAANGHGHKSNGTAGHV